MILVQVSNGGKWHAVHPSNAWKTACGWRAGVTSTRRDSDLVDSGDKCLDPKCIAGRTR